MCVLWSPVAGVADLLVYDAGLPYLGEFFQALSNPEEAVLGHYFFSGCLTIVSLAASSGLYMFATFSLHFNL